MIGKSLLAAKYGVTFKTILRLLNEKGVKLEACKTRKFLTPLEVAAIYDAIGAPPER